MLSSSSAVGYTVAPRVSPPNCFTCAYPCNLSRSRLRFLLSILSHYTIDTLCALRSGCTSKWTRRQMLVTGRQGLTLFAPPTYRLLYLFNSYFLPVGHRLPYGPVHHEARNAAAADATGRPGLNNRQQIAPYFALMGHISGRNITQPHLFGLLCYSTNMAPNTAQGDSFSYLTGKTQYIDILCQVFSPDGHLRAQYMRTVTTSIKIAAFCFWPF